MGQWAQSDELTARVVAAPGFSVVATPLVQEVAAGDLDMVARYHVVVTRQLGYEKPVFLLVAGYSDGEFKMDGQSIMVPQADYAVLPADKSECDLEVDLSGYAAGFEIKFSVGGYEDEPVPTP